MKKSCSYCGRIHEVGIICPAKPKKKATRYEEGSTFRYYGTGEWQTLRARVKHRDRYLCRVCADGKYIDFTRGHARQLDVHHITKTADDYSRRNDESNLITLCREHHKMADDGSIPEEYLRGLVGKEVEWK